MQMWMFKRCGTSDTFDVSVKFGISSLLHHVVTTLVDRIRELLEYIDVHDNDASESSKPSWGKIGEVGYSTSLSMVCVKCVAYVRRIVANFLHVPRTDIQQDLMTRSSESAQDRNVGLGGSLFRNFTKKESMKKTFQDMLHGLGEVNITHAYYNGSKSKDNEDLSWSTSLKTRITQKTSSTLEALWKTLFLM
ncbi:hypothetical protein Tco_0169051, partial [Tanacetum coccineum]